MYLAGNWPWPRSLWGHPSSITCIGVFDNQACSHAHFCTSRKQLHCICQGSESAFYNAHGTLCSAQVNHVQVGLTWSLIQNHSRLCMSRTSETKRLQYFVVVLTLNKVFDVRTYFDPVFQEKMVMFINKKAINEVIVLFMH